ncbi:Hint domain-containing protein [Streptomyces sp. ME18-1-4]|nr:Hint domain-containing protein [Streptomyces sp. ME18-1-4]MDX3245840.1 Hint domain-containing protein [Streptomyces sp. ME18-1-4]
MTATMDWAEHAAREFEPRDVFGLLGYVPTPKQQVFHAATEFDVLFGGSAGGGKTRALLMDDLRDCMLYPGLRIGAFRRTFGELKESLIAELAQASFAKALGAKWNGTEYELRFPNGSLIMYRYAESVQDATRRQGGQYQKLTFDERTLTAPDVVSFLESRLRSGRRDIPVVGIRSGTNPGGPGHGAVKTRYIKPTNYGQNVIHDVRGRTVRFIPSKLSDNPHVNAEYAQDLQALDGKLRSAFLDGDWDVFQGQMFPELKRDRHVIEPITLPASWKRYNGVDWGFSAPWAVLWAAVDEDGRVWVYREIYQRGVGEADQAKRILAAEAAGEHVAVRFADDAMWATRGDAKAIADVYAENGVHLTQAGKGAGSRVTGWQRVRSYLKEGPACPHHRAQGWTTCPMVHMFSTVTELYRELTDLPHATKGDPEDADTTADDHACLIAGTVVETARGSVPIEQISAGDMVWTREGLRFVRAAGLTAMNSEVGSVQLSNGTVIEGTDNHPVWVYGKGWTLLGDLRYQDRILVWDQLTASPSTASPSVDIQTPKTGRTARTTPPVLPTGSEVSGGSIRKSGKLLTVRYPRATTFITKMRTLSTTASLTWHASLLRSTTPSTPRPVSSLRGWKRLTRWLWSVPPNGIDQKRGARGIRSTESESGRGASSPHSRVSNAAASINRAQLTEVTASAPTTARRNGARRLALMTKTAHAPSAGTPSASTNTQQPAHAPVFVVRGFAASSQRADVYNLTVDGAHEFFANGVLVHNCDAVRYLLTNLGTGPEMVILDEVPAEPVAEALQPLGMTMAVRADPGVVADDAWWTDDDDDTPRAGRTVESPWG